MHITLSPMRRDETLTLERQGDALILNGELFDFSPLPEGATLPVEAIPSDWFAGPVQRDGGQLQVMLVLPHGPNAPQNTRFPAPIDNPPAGGIALPPYAIEDTEDA